MTTIMQLEIQINSTFARMLRIQAGLELIT